MINTVQNTRDTSTSSTTGTNSASLGHSTGNVPFSMFLDNGQKGPAYWRARAESIAREEGIDPTLFARQIRQESAFNPRAQSSAGAKGIAEFMDETASGLGVNPFDAETSLRAAARLMHSYINTYGGWAPALAAYNAGPGRLATALRAGARWQGHLPSETRAYLQIILGGQSPGLTASSPRSGASLFWGQIPTLSSTEDTPRSSPTNPAEVSSPRR